MCSTKNIYIICGAGNFPKKKPCKITFFNLRERFVQKMVFRIKRKGDRI